MCSMGVIINLRNFASYLQRIFTKSNYYHLAAVLGSSAGTLKFIEATTQYCVDIIDWVRFVDS